MLPVSGALQLQASGARKERPITWLRKQDNTKLHKKIYSRRCTKSIKGSTAITAAWCSLLRRWKGSNQFTCLHPDDHIDQSATNVQKLSSMVRWYLIACIKALFASHLFRRTSFHSHEVQKGDWLAKNVIASWALWGPLTFASFDVVLASPHSS